MTATFGAQEGFQSGRTVDRRVVGLTRCDVGAPRERSADRANPKAVLVTSTQHPDRMLRLIAACASAQQIRDQTSVEGVAVRSKHAGVILTVGAIGDRCLMSPVDNHCRRRLIQPQWKGAAR